MKDCKWNPPTAGSKGIHLDEHGRIIDRAALAAIPANSRMLKLITEDGDRRARRRAERQVEAWIADGSYAKLLAGEIDPPTGWTLHTHRPDGTGYNFTKKLYGFHLDDVTEDHRPLVDAAIKSLLDQGRVSHDELFEPSRIFFTAGNYDTVVKLTGSPTTAVELLVRHGELALRLDAADPRLATKLDLLRAAPSSLADPAWGSLVAPGTLLEHAATTGMDQARFAEIVSRAEDISRSAGITADSFSDRYAFGELVTRPAGPLGDDTFALTYLSVLADPTEQRALAIVLAAADRFGRSPSGIAADVAELPDGANDLDSLVRFTAAHLRAGHIHGDRATATTLLLECVAGNLPEPSASVALASAWPHGSLGTVSARELLHASSPVSVLDQELRQRTGLGLKDQLGATVATTARHELHHALMNEPRQTLAARTSAVLDRAATGSWDTVLLDSNTRDELIVAAALVAQRTPEPPAKPDPSIASAHDEMAPAVTPDPEFERLLQNEEILHNVAFLEQKRSFRDLARRTAEEASVEAWSHETLALALLSDATTGGASTELGSHVQLLAGFLTTGRCDTDALTAGPTVAVLAALADDCEALATGVPAAALAFRFAGLADPEHAQRLYHQARAAAGDLVGTTVEVCPPTVETRSKIEHLSSAAQTVVYRALDATHWELHTPSVTLALAPGQNPSAVAARAMKRLDADGVIADVKIRENELVVTVPDTRDAAEARSAAQAAHAVLVAEFARDNDAARNRVLARRNMSEFERLLDDEGR